MDPLRIVFTRMDRVVIMDILKSLMDVVPIDHMRGEHSNVLEVIGNRSIVVKDLDVYIFYIIVLAIQYPTCRLKFVSYGTDRPRMAQFIKDVQIQLWNYFSIKTITGEPAKMDTRVARTPSELGFVLRMIYIQGKPYLPPQPPPPTQ